MPSRGSDPRNVWPDSTITLPRVARDTVHCGLPRADGMAPYNLTPHAGARLATGGARERAFDVGRVNPHVLRVGGA
jgi:hypothetical protein